MGNALSVAILVCGQVLLLMVGIHARNTPLGMENRNRVDDNPENACILGQKSYAGL